MKKARRKLHKAGAYNPRKTTVASVDKDEKKLPKKNQLPPH